jgi:hypothetical protein
MKRLLFAAAASLLLGTSSLHAQENEISFTIILTPGDSLRQEGDMYGAIDAYKKSIASGNIYASGNHSVDRSVYFGDTYNLACAFSRIGQQDSAVKYLERFTAESNDSVGEALADPDLVNIRSASGWPKLESIIIRNYCSKSGISIKDMAYARKLWHMSAIDQAYYKDITLAEQKTGKTSSVVLALWDLKKKLNGENQKELAKLLQEKGWPKKSVVGAGCANTAFLIIQHAGLPLQQKYLPVIKDLCKAGEAGWQEYALMYDRIQVSSGKAQRYGSQVRYNSKTQQSELFDLENPEKVDEWRKELGLQSLSAYLKNFQIEWPARK